MANHKYNFQKKIDEKKCAKVYKSNLKISTKYATEFSNYLKNKKIDKAIKILENIEQKKEHLPLLKYNLKIGHKKGDAKRGTKTGRYPIKCAKVIKEILIEAKANAENKDLEVEKLKIIHMFAVKGITRTKLQSLGHIGGKTRESKSTNLEVIVLEE